MASTASSRGAAGGGGGGGGDGRGGAGSAAAAAAAAASVAIGHALGQAGGAGLTLIQALEGGLHLGNGGEARIGVEHGVVSQRDEFRMEFDDERVAAGRGGGAGDGAGPGAGSDGAGFEEKNDGGSRAEKRWKGDRWTSHESMVLVSAKKQVEEDSSAPVRGGDAKWKQIAHICSSHCVQRTSFQCRKRWNTLLAAYKKIKDWERKNGAESYWLMGGTDLRAKKLPAGFDEGIWNVMDSFLAGRPGVSPKLLAGDSDTPPGDHHASTTADALQADGGTSLLHGSTKAKREKEPALRKKRKRAGGGSQEQQPLAADVEQKKTSTSQEPGTEALDRFSQYMSSIVNRAIECYDRNSELNRNLRREQGENLVAVLGTLASAVRDLVQQNSKY